MAVPVDILSKCVVAWITAMCIFLFICVKDNMTTKFFRFGPHEDLFLFGIAIDSYFRYCLVVFYTFVGTILRTLQAEVIRPWVIQEIQNSKPKSEYVVNNSYFVVSSDAALTWFDFFMYINILLSQIDFVFLEAFWTLCTSLFTTTQYLRNAPRTYTTDGSDAKAKAESKTDLESGSYQHPERKES